MSDTNGNGDGGSGRHSGPFPRSIPPVIHGSDQTSPTVLPTPNLITAFLDPDDIRKVNVIQLEYARKVAEAQTKAYDDLIEVFGNCPTGRHSGFP